MKRKVAVVLLVLALLAGASPVLASGGQNHGDVGQGAAYCVAQPADLPAYNGPQKP